MRKDMLPTLTPVPSGVDTSPEGSNGLPTALDSRPAAESLPSPSDEQEVLFRPTEHQLKMKARFWHRWSPTFAETDPSKVTLARAVAITGSETMRRWWIQPGFRGWFLNAQVHQEKLSYLLHLSLAAMEDMLLNVDPKAQGARMAAVKMVMDLSEKLAGISTGPKDKQTEALQAMSREELEKLIISSTGLKLQKTQEPTQ